MMRSLTFASVTSPGLLTSFVIALCNAMTLANIMYTTRQRSNGLREYAASKVFSS